MHYPLAMFRPVMNHDGPLAGPALGLVVHVQEGNNSLYGRFNDPATQVSAHWWISKLGVVEQYVDTTLQAWAQAVGNAQYLSVETEGFDYEPLTPEQLAQLGKLWEWVRTVYLLPNEMTDHGGRGLTTHAFYPSGIPDPAWGGHPCPGTLRANQLPAIVAGLPAEEVDAVKFVWASPGQPTYVQSGDLVWQTEDAKPYIDAGFVVVQVPIFDIGKIGAKAAGTG